MLLPRHIYWPRRPIKLDYIYFHVGRLAFQWAEVEDAMCCLIELYQAVLEDEDFEWPRSTKRRIETLRAQLLRLPAHEVPAHYLECARDCIDRFASAAEHRQWAAHGVAWDGTWDSKDTIISYRKSRQGDGEPEHRTYDLAEIESLADECRDLNSAVWDLWQDFAWAFEFIDELIEDNEDPPAELRA